MEVEVFCDESRHLEHDKDRFMLIGSIWCIKNQKKSVIGSIKDAKLRYNILGEIKWKKVSKSRIEFYKELIKIFFQNPYVSFRCIVIDKEGLDHNTYNEGDHEVFFYKAYYYLMKKKIEPPNEYYIYLDYKSPANKLKVQKLEEILKNTFHDFFSQVIKRIQSLSSKDSLLIQLTDFLIGAVGYQYNGYTTSESKILLCDEICKYTLTNDLVFSSLPTEKKFDIFYMKLRAGR